MSIRSETSKEEITFEMDSSLSSDQEEQIFENSGSDEASQASQEIETSQTDEISEAMTTIQNNNNQGPRVQWRKGKILRMGNGVRFLRRRERVRDGAVRIVGRQFASEPDHTIG